LGAPTLKKNPSLNLAPTGILATGYFLLLFYGIPSIMTSSYKQRRHHMRLPRKLNFYTPGLYSLALLLPLCMLQFYWFTISRKQFTIEVRWYDPSDTSYFAQKIPVRNYTFVNITRDDIANKARIDSIKKAVLELSSCADTTSGVRVHFSDTARYESFVDVLNIVNSDDRLFPYQVYQNDFWIFYGSKDVDNPKQFICGTHSLDL
jgi:hypothetical protein